MKQLVLDIPEKDFDLFLQLVKRFKFTYKETNEELPTEVKRLLDKRKAESKDGDFLTLSQFKKKFKGKYGI
ncbi:MAG: hypothetical protein Q8M29_06040 [Bacteroidota bacterium]|nr:hypothetical protein [Bacteroidota bacterium]